MSRCSYKPILTEAVIIAGVGAAIAFGANGLSPRGIDLKRNYFPADTTVQPVSSASQSPITNTVSSEENVAERLKQKGLQPIDTAAARLKFDDPRRLQQQIIFIDVRNDHEFREGHIPRSYHFDFYYPGNTMGQVIAACQPAQEIIVYCGGGKCDLSENAALMLRDNAGIPAAKLFVYTGGMTEWKDKSLPVETGDQNSGKLLNSNGR
jgi:rhodanese-related sulfurtransferase